jgi:exonuclease V gamma subunit
VTNLEIDASEFEGDLEDLTRILHKKLQTTLKAHHKKIEIDKVLSNSVVRGALRQSLNKLAPESYNVISQSGTLMIKKVKPHHHVAKRKKGMPPPATQSLPYFFPG